MEQNLLRYDHGGTAALPRRRGALGVLFAALLALVALQGGRAQAQEALDVDTVLANVTDAARALEDAAFQLTGRLVNPDGTTVALELDILVMPPLSLASAYIIQPDALADNIVLLDGDAVYNYTFLTNQVMIFDADDPDALGGLLPTGEDGATANLDFDLGAIFEGYEASIVELFDGPFGPTYRLHFTNKDPEATILDVEAEVPTADWLPRKLVFMQADGHVLAELNAEALETNVGMSPEQVRELPDDAEVIDNRR